MATTIPKYVQNKDVWNKLVKPEWVGSFSGGGVNPVRLDLKNGKVFSAADVASIPDSEKPYVLVNKRYVDGELVHKAGKAELDALQNFTTVQFATLGAQVNAVPDVEWDDVVDKPDWTSDFEGGDATHIMVGNSINMSDNIIYGLPKPLAGTEYRKQATNREYVDDSIAASDVIMNQAIEDKAEAIMSDLAPVLENLKFPEYDNVKNVPAHIQWMTWTDLPGQTNIPIQMLMPLDMNHKEILNVPQPISLDNAANKGYVDESVATRLSIAEFDQTITNYPTSAEMEKHVIDYTTNTAVNGFWTKIVDAIAASAIASNWASVEKTGPAWLKTVLTVPRSGVQGDLDTLTQIQGGLDMGGARIQNLSEPLNDNDAVPYNFFKNALTSSANPKFVYDPAITALKATADIEMNNNTIGGLKLVDSTNPALAYTPGNDEAVSKKHLTDMLAGFTGGGSAALPDWTGDVAYSSDKQSIVMSKTIQSSKLVTPMITGLTTYADTDDGSMPVTIKHYDQGKNVVRRFEIQNVIDQLFSVKWKFVKSAANDTYDYDFSVAYNPIDAYKFFRPSKNQVLEVIVYEVGVTNGVRNGTLTKKGSFDLTFPVTGTAPAVNTLTGTTSFSIAGTPPLVLSYKLHVPGAFTPSPATDYSITDSRSIKCSLPLIKVMPGLGYNSIQLVIS